MKKFGATLCYCCAGICALYYSLEIYEKIRYAIRKYGDSRYFDGIDRGFKDGSVYSRTLAKLEFNHKKSKEENEETEED